MANKSTKRTAKIAARRAKVGALYLAGLTQPQIAREMGVAQSTISGDIKAMIGKWENDAIEALNDKRQRESAEYSALQLQAITAYYESVTGDRPEGDPRFLAEARAAVAGRVALWGLAVSKIAQTNPEGDEPYSAAPENALLAAVRAIVAAADA